MRTILTVALLLAPAFVSANPNEAQECAGRGVFGVMEISVPNGPQDPRLVFYLDDRNFALGNGVWIYQESNGVYDPARSAIDNVQRGGASAIVPGDAEICDDNDPAGPDTLIY
jgi:hypothetical protein